MQHLDLDTLRLPQLAGLRVAGRAAHPRRVAGRGVGSEVDRGVGVLGCDQRGRGKAEGRVRFEVRGSGRLDSISCGCWD